jgi:preprotein translocase subunit YajC
LSQYLPLVVLAAVLAGMVAFSRRNKQRAAAAEAARQHELGPGSEVMTTSGLYGTVVAVHDDGTALLSIAAGVEVKWAIAALRGVEELPERYRGAIEGQRNPETAEADEAEPR